MERRQRFEAMYVEYGAALRTFVHRRVDLAMADDVVADAFLIAWRRLDEVPEDPLPWLIGIARGVLANARRAQARRLHLHERIADQTSRSCTTDDGARGQSPVLEALELVSERDREVLLLVAWDGLDRTQAARALGITTAQFAVRLHRARRRLQRTLDQGRSELNPVLQHPASEVS